MSTWPDLVVAKVRESTARSAVPELLEDDTAAARVAALLTRRDSADPQVLEAGAIRTTAATPDHRQKRRVGRGER